MALAHAILTTLLDERLTGYDLAKLFDSGMGFFWRASHQQIYQELFRLAGEGLVRGEVIEQADRPNRIPYAITAKGRKHLLAWAAGASAPAAIKDDLLVKCHALGLLKAEDLRAQILERRGHHVAQLALYERMKAKLFPKPAALKDKKLGQYISLCAGIRYEKGWLDWADEAAGLLAKAPSS